MGEGRWDAAAGKTTGVASPPPLTPLRGFMLAVVVAIAGGFAFAGLRGNGARSGGSPVTPAPSASEASRELPAPDTGEALAIFTELRGGLERVYRRRDPRSLAAVVKPGSPQFKAVRRDLRLLATNNLLDRTRTRTLGLVVVESDPGRIVVRERVLVRPHYVDDATYVALDVDLERSRVTSEWTIEREGVRWRIVRSRTGN